MLEKISILKKWNRDQSESIQTSLRSKKYGNKLKMELSDHRIKG